MSIPHDLNVYHYGEKQTTVEFNFNGTTLKLLSYIDASCNICLNDLFGLESFVDEIKDSGLLPIFIIGHINEKTLLDPENIFLNFKYHILLDKEGIFPRCNNLPGGNFFRTFLLDSNNKVLLIGSPFLSEETKALYISTINAMK